MLFACFRFVPTLVHANLDSTPCNIISGGITRFLGAACDSFWCAAAAHLVSFWLENLTSVTFVSTHPVTRTKTCCWLSLPASVIFALARFTGAIVMPFRPYHVVQTLGIVVAMCTVSGIFAIGTFAMIHFWCSTSWRDALSGDVRLRIHRMSRFLAVSGVLFVLLSAAMCVFNFARASANSDYWYNNPLVALAWDIPKRVCRLALYSSLALACHSFDTPSGARCESKTGAPSAGEHERAHVVAAAREALSTMNMEPEELDVIENVLQRAATEDGSRANDRARVIAAARKALSTMNMEPEELDVIENVLQRAATEDGLRAASGCVEGSTWLLLRRLNAVQVALARQCQHVQREKEAQLKTLSPDLKSVKGQGGGVAMGAIVGRECFKIAVRFHANPSHDLTCSPYHILFLSFRTTR